MTKDRKLPIIVTDEPIDTGKSKWAKYIQEYNLKPFVDKWTDGPSALLYYVSSNEEIVKHLRATSDIPVITVKEMKLLQSKNPLKGDNNG